MQSPYAGSFVESVARPTGVQLKWETKPSVSRVIPRPIVTIILCEKNTILTHNFGNNALAKHRFAMERQCLSEAFRKENDDVI